MDRDPNCKRRRFTAVDLFAGCGGLTTGLKKAGFRVVAAVEIDPLAANTYRKNHRATTLYQKDVRRLSASELAKNARILPGKIDLLAGCPPCQAFSRLRTLNRSQRVRDPKQKDLLNEILRFVRVLKPKTVMVENVPGLAFDRRWKYFVSRLRKMKYSCQYDILNCVDYSVPQRRRRLILMASRFGEVPFAPAISKRSDVRKAIGFLKPAGSSGDPLHDFPENRSPKIMRLIRRIPRNGGSRRQLGARKQLHCHLRCDGFKDIYGRMHWRKPSPTITSGCFNPSKGRFLHPAAHRSITLREAALIQTFPPRYYFDLANGKSAVAAMIGNALPPEFVKQHAIQLRRHLAAR
jgi:DNA (cytosine-5)-methyltransferase 1